MRWALSAFALFAAEQANAQSGTVVDSCISIANDLDRLACYDSESGRTPSISVTPPAPDNDWSVRSSTSRMTDDTDVFLYVSSEEPIDCGRLSDPARVTLWVRCVENTTAMVFSTECHMTSSDYNDYGHVDLRIDDRPARTVPMTESTDNEALGLWTGAQAIPEIKELFGGAKLLARMTPYSESPFTANFNIAGLEDAIAPLREACGW